MSDLLASHGFVALFLVSFLAATLIPLGSEWLLITLLTGHADPLSAVSIATAGNYLGACTTYAIGIYGSTVLMEKVLRIDADKRLRSERFVVRYGSWALLLSWLPVIGDALCLAGGVLRIPFGRFSLLVAGGKAARYSLVSWLTLAGMQGMPA
jgi:membrane protein YqaA with SNARE-associated domain